MYEYYQPDDVSHMAEAHRKALLHGTITTPIYRFKTKDKGFVRLQSEWKSFKNPWTKDVEYLIAKNSVILLVNHCAVRKSFIFFKYVSFAEPNSKKAMPRRMVNRCQIILISLIIVSKPKCALNLLNNIKI